MAREARRPDGDRSGAAAGLNGTIADDGATASATQARAPAVAHSGAPVEAQRFSPTIDGTGALRTPDDRGALLEAALAYAAIGWRVHPLKTSAAPGPNEPKKPILTAWQKLATTDEWQIQRWWQQYPRANIGVVCGGPARLLVVDVDPDKGGEASFAQLEAEHGAMPETVEVITPSGGRHLYYRVPEGRSLLGNSAGRIGPGIDTHAAKAASS